MPDDLAFTPFNLIRTPWIPARRRSGAVEQIPPWRINDRIGEDPFVSFAWPRPDFDGAAHEFLIGLLSSASAPEDDDEWEDGWLHPPEPETLERKFEPLAYAFDLDGAGPRFLQDLDPLESAEDKEVAALLIDSPGAQTLRNNADHFVKRGGAPSPVPRRRRDGAIHAERLRPFGRCGPPHVASRWRPDDDADCRWPRGVRRYPVGTSLAPTWRPGSKLSCVLLKQRCRRIRAWSFPGLARPAPRIQRRTGQRTTPRDAHPLQVYWGMPRRIRLLFEESQGTALRPHRHGGHHHG